MENYKKQNIFHIWFSWHFYEVPRFLLGVWKNYILFALNYFSLPILLKTFFSPWRKYRWRYPRGFDIPGFFSAFISNSFSRIIGSLIRIALIIIGMMFQVFVIFAGLIIFLIWIFIPFIIIMELIFVLIY